MSSDIMITQRRKHIGLTQEKLAEQINVSRQTIAMWETSKQFPSDAAITDNLGNQYDSFPGSNSGYNKEEGFYSNKEVDIDPNATSISFKYLFTRKIITFELRDLPLPS